MILFSILAILDNLFSPLSFKMKIIQKIKMSLSEIYVYVLVENLFDSVKKNYFTLFEPRPKFLYQSQFYSRIVHNKYLRQNYSDNLKNATNLKISH